MKKLFEKQLWKKFNLFSFKNVPQVIEDQQLKKKSSYLTHTSLSNFASVGLFAFGVTVLKSVFSSSPSVDTFKTKPGL